METVKEIVDKSTMPYYLDKEMICAKFALFTHGEDIDGAGCEVLYDKIFSSYISLYFKCNYKDVKDRLSKFIEEDDSSFIFITDLSFKEDQDKDIIEELDRRGNVKLIDHHKTSLWLNDYKWATVDTSKCATYLFYKYLIDGYIYKEYPLNRIYNKDILSVLGNYLDFVELTNDYDLYLKKNPLSSDMDMFYKVVGHDAYVNRFLDNPEVRFNLFEQLIIDHGYRKREEYINKVLATMIWTTDKNGNFVGFVIADKKYASYIGQKAFETTSCDYITIIDPVNMEASLRSNGKVDVSKIAEKFGGGGHPNAAGFPLKGNINNKLVGDFLV